MNLRATPLAALVLVLAIHSAAAEKIPGTLEAASIEAGKREAAEQKRDAQEVIRRSAKKLNYTEEQIKQVLEPTMVRESEFTITLEDGTEIAMPWHRIGFAENELANTNKPIARDKNGKPLRRETNKGGIRLEKGVFADEVYALALKMDNKLALAGDAVDGESVRGAKGGIGAGRVIKVGMKYTSAKVGDYIDPTSPVFDRQILMERFGDAYVAAGGKVGAGFDVQAGDVNTKAREMATLARFYSLGGVPSPGVSGKAVLKREDGSIDPNGGIEYRSISTGEGVWMSTRLAARRIGLKLRGATVVGQGWGEVGAAFGRAAIRDGARIVAIQNLWKVGGELKPGVLLHPQGENASPWQVRAFLGDVDAFIQSGESIETFQQGKLAPHFRAGMDASEVKADIVGVNALGNVLTDKTVPAYARSGTHQGKAKILAEGANLAETAEGAATLDRLGNALLAIPGDLANVGGVHISNAELLQNLSGTVISDKAARKSLQHTVLAGWRRSTKLADTLGISVRAAVELAAVDAMMSRSLQKNAAPRRDLADGLLGKPNSKSAQARFGSTGRLGTALPTRAQKPGNSPPRSHGRSR